MIPSKMSVNTWHSSPAIQCSEIDWTITGRGIVQSEMLYKGEIKCILARTWKKC